MTARRAALGTVERSAPGTERRGGVLACTCLCTVVVVGFVASINLAVPLMSTSALHPSATQLLWIIDAYVVLFACLVIPAGALGDRVGRKRVLMAGLGLFALGALASASAPNVAVVLGGRCVTGVGAACVLPNCVAVLIQTTPPGRRARALAVWAAMSGVGGVVGNVGGGAVLALGSWRWLFVAVAPIAAVCLIWVAWAVPADARRAPGAARRVDLPGATLLTLATGALMLGIIQGPEQGWGDAVVVGGFIAAVLVAGGWVLCELRTPEPMLDPRVLRVPELRAACLGMLVVFFGMFGFFYLNASLMQYGRGFSVLQAGVGVIPLSVPLVLGARFVPALARRCGTRLTLAIAFAMTAAGIDGLASTLREGYLAYASCMVVAGAGITLALPTLTAAIAMALPAEQSGVAGGLQATTRELGSALGVAVVGSVLTARFSHLLLEGGLGAVARSDAPRTVGDALRVAPQSHQDVVAAYISSAGTALQGVALLVAVAGALVVAEMSWSARRRATAPPGATPAR